eukprot:4079339-Heterocapsa_arctica.AAC.1
MMSPKFDEVMGQGVGSHRATPKHASAVFGVHAGRRKPCVAYCPEVGDLDARRNARVGFG